MVASNMQFSARDVWQGIGAGAVAGLVFAIVAIAVAAGAGAGSDLPFRIFHSLWFGELAFREHAGGPPREVDIAIVGSIVHLTISVLAGIGYALIAAGLRQRRPLALEHHAALGIGYGLVLWLVNFQVLGRIFYPWLLELPQAGLAVLHAFAFGLPVGLVCGVFEARYGRAAEVHHGAVRGS